MFGLWIMLWSVFKQTVCVYIVLTEFFRPLPRSYA